MRMTPLNTAEDLQWLLDVHKIDARGAALALLFGNEDSPSKVEVYAVNDYRCPPVVHRFD